MATTNGKKHYNQIYQPELEELTHGERHCYENGVAQCLGEWLAMEPSPDPKSHMLDFMKCNKNCEILGYVPEREFTTYRKYVRDNKKFRQIETKITGRRDQTIYCPKDLTFGKCSAERECIYDILTHKEAKEWIKQRRLLDAEICKELIEKFRKKKDHALTRSSELRSAWNHQIVHPPAESPREPTRLRRRAKPKISTTWDIEEAVSLLNCHPEADYRLKKFSLPSKHNLYYNKLHQPDVLDHVIKQPDERKNEIIKDCEGNTAETGNLNTGCQVGCKQCGTLQCCCATLEKPEQAAKNEAEALPSLAHQVLSKDRHVMFNDVVKEHD